MMEQGLSRASVRTVLAFSLPIMISQACDSLMMFTDRYLLARLDPLFASAAMAGGMTALLFWIFATGLLSFTTALVSQYSGAKDDLSAKHIVPQGLILSLLLSLPLFLWGERWGEIYFQALKMPAAEYPLASTYLGLMMKASLFVFAKVVFASFFAGVGKTKVVMTVNLVGLGLNAFLSYFFIQGGLGHAWQGVRPAALATLCAELVMAFIYLLLFVKNYRQNLRWHLNIRICKKLIIYGTTTGLEFLALVFAFNTFLTMFHAFGVDAAQAITVTMNWSWLTVLPFLGLNIGLMSLCGRAMGESRPDLAVEIIRSGFKIAFTIVGIASMGFLGFSKDLLAFFAITPATVAYELAQTMVRTLPLYCLFDALSFVLTASLRASGDTRFCLALSSMCHWSCLGLCFYGTYYGSFSPLSIWWIFILTLSLQAGGFAYRFLKGGWKSLRLVGRDNYSV